MEKNKHINKQTFRTASNETMIISGLTAYKKVQEQGLCTGPRSVTVVTNREEENKVRESIPSTLLGVLFSGSLREARTYHAAGSYSAQTRMNSSRWWGPRMEESLVRYSKLSIMTATNRLSIWNTDIRLSLRPCFGMVAPAFKGNQLVSMALRKELMIQIHHLNKLNKLTIKV